MIWILLICSLILYKALLNNKRQTIKRGDRIGRFLVIKIEGEWILLTDGTSHIYTRRGNINLTHVKGLK